MNVYDTLDAHIPPEEVDPPLPSYQALMASEGHAPAPFRTFSADRAPYAPVDYGIPSSAYPAAPNGYRQTNSSTTDQHRLSGGSLGRRSSSDPNQIDFSNLQITSFAHGTDQNAVPQYPVTRHKTAPTHPQHYQPGGGHNPRRAMTVGYEGNDTDGAASVYSLDTGMGVYGGGVQRGFPQGRGGQGYDAFGGQAQQPLQPDYNNPYLSAASDVLGLPPVPPSEHTYSAGPSSAGPTRQPSIASLGRSNTAMTSMSSFSPQCVPSIPQIPPVPAVPSRITEQVGASSTRRRGTQAAVDLNKPPYTKQYVDDYRKRMKDDPDPEAQFAFAKYLIEAAKKLGDEMSQSDPKLGRKYRDSLLAESLRNIRKLAEGKETFPDAQFFLANLYGTGQLGLAVDHEKAFYLYLMASKNKHPAATYRSAVCNEIGAGTKRDPGRAVLFYRKAAALGDTAAMYKLGMILLGGLLSQQRNIREAIVWLQRAASQADEDNPHALHELALLHERPGSAASVLPHDPNLARELFTQAAQLGYAPAQFKLGQCHEFGHLGCPIDPRRSIGWYTRAAEKGDGEAELALSGWYLTGSEGVLKQSDKEAYLWGRKAANKGLAKAEYAVGYYTEIGIGVSQDIGTAKRWYMRAAAQQHKRAMQRLTELSNQRAPKGKGARPTRDDAQSECNIM
nr:enzyme activator [Cryptococcus depauperatus CBS 7841]